MATIESLKQKYAELDRRFSARLETGIDPECLLTFDYEFPGHDADIAIDTQEFTAKCPWTGLPDFGELIITYTPHLKCLELKSLKYYLMSYGEVSIVQEHAANRILEDLVAICDPKHMVVSLDYNVWGGLHTAVVVRHDQN